MQLPKNKNIVKRNSDSFKVICFALISVFCLTDVSQKEIYQNQTRVHRHGDHIQLAALTNYKTIQVTQTAAHSAFVFGRPKRNSVLVLQ